MTKDKKAKIVYDRDACIGAAACEALDPKNFVMNGDGRADMLDSKEIESGLFEKEVDEITNESREAAKNCPVKAIILKEIKEHFEKK